jgi:hypothetical protein
VFLSPFDPGRDPLVSRDLLPIANKTDLRAQRKLWKWLRSGVGS